MFALSVLSSPYPQRHEYFDPTWLNRLAERVRAALKARVKFGVRYRERLVREVEAIHDEAWLHDPVARHEFLRELRWRLRRGGFSDAACVVQLLALVRQVAHETLGLQPHPTQIAGAFVLLHGQVVEMDTGEGKSLTAALGAACVALAGFKTHVVTVNDYLAQRDCEEFSQFYAALGLTTGLVQEAMQPGEKVAPYQCDVVYCCNKIVVFDYLRDRLALGEDMHPLGLAVEALTGAKQQQILLPGLQFAIVDEADSVFVDEARTPLVISSEREDAERVEYYHTALKLARALEDGVHFERRPGQRGVRITSVGLQRLGELAADLQGLWRGPRLREDAVTQALTAVWDFRRDIDYIVQDGKALIVDENTGRVMPDRTWERGMQQLIEAKEGLQPSAERENMARLSYQLFFRRYLHLAGMTGTCREVSGELGEVYGLGVVRVEPFRISCRRRLPTRIFARSAQRWQAVVEAIYECQQRGQPVLVGTRSILASEQLSDLLQVAGVDHRVLNAKQNSDEATIIAAAGQRGQVTIATNMAGRGTDIKLGTGVLELGGLHVILTEGYDNTRVDRQLIGRCARQGDPGSWQALLSLDDEIMRVAPSLIRRTLQAWMTQGSLSGLCERLALAVYRLMQGFISLRHRGERRRLLRADFGTRQALSFSGVAE